MKLTAHKMLALINELRLDDNSMCLKGWILHRGEPLTDVSVTVDSKPWVDRVGLEDRPDVAEFFGLPHAARSGIDVTAPITRTSLDKTVALRLIARSEGHTVGTLDITWRDQTAESRRLPLPPAALQDRVGRLDFLASGWRIYNDLKSAVAPYIELSRCGSILDWGCGSGRTLRYLLEDVSPERVYGCDIDADAISWLRSSIKGPSFTPIEPFPPTPYADQSFAFVYGISVFTHLDEPTQIRWLEELQRITAPDGIVAVSVLGASLAPPDLQRIAQKKGFADVISGQSGTFEAYSSPEYYRMAYHNRKYIVSEWSRYFRILEIVERGINAHQDLVIMRRRGKSNWGRLAFWR